MQFPKQNDVMLITNNDRSCLLLQIVLLKEGIQEYKIAISNCNNKNKPMAFMTYRKKQL